MHIHDNVPTASAAPPFSRSTTTRANARLDDTAQPSLTSGFGAVMEQERAIQSSTRSHLEAHRGAKSTSVDRILNRQEGRLGANIALLEERYEMLPHPVRFQALHTKSVRPDRGDQTPTVRDDNDFLAGLVAQHLSLLRKIDALIATRPDGQRGELILAEIARNHEEMAQMIKGLIREEDTARDLIPTPTIAAVPASVPNVSEANWENEGGARSRGQA